MNPLKQRLTKNIIVVGLSAVCANAAFAGPSHYVGGALHGFSDGETEATAFTAGYEIKFTDIIGLSARLVSFDYEWEDKPEKEEGDGRGVEVAAHFYPGGGDFFLGAGIGLGFTEWEWEERGEYYNDYEEDDNFSVEILGRLGYRFELDGFYIMPQAQLSSWLNTGEEVGAFLIAGLELGAKF